MYRVCIIRTCLIAVLFIITINFSVSQPVHRIPEFNSKSKYSEEIYVRTDRDIYITGEQVFLKAFCFGRLTHKSSDASTVAYVSLLDPSNDLVLQVKIRITRSSGSGYFTLPDSLRTGNYTIATCTSWMQNLSPELFSYKNICVVNPFRNIDNSVIASMGSEPDTVIFYPESGGIIAGVENIIGFRSFGVNMVPVEIGGVIADSMGHVLCKVHSDMDGFGIFRLTPQEKGRLFLKPEAVDSKSGRYELPPVCFQGIGMSVAEDPENGIFRVKVLTGNVADGQNRIYNLIYEHVSLGPVLLKTFPANTSEIILQKRSVPSGLASLVLTDEDGNRYAQRWIYNNLKEPFNISIIPDKQSYSEREKIRINILTTDSSGKSLNSNLVVSAVRAVTLTETGDDSGEILQISGLPLGGRQQGAFDNFGKLIFLEIKDSLSKYNTSEEELLHLPESNGHIISGTIRNTITGEPLRQKNLVLSFVGKTALCRFTKTDDDGRFIFVSHEEGIRELVIQPLSPEPDGYYIELDDPYPGSFKKSYSHSAYIDTGLLAGINKAVISMQVKRTYDALIKNKTEVIQSGIINDFYGLPDFTTRMSDFIQLTSLREALKELVPGAVTSVRNGKTVINTINKRNYQIELKDPLVLVDGVPVFDHDKVLNIQGDRIEKIEVLNTGYVVSDIYLDGIIDITTKKGDLSSIEFDKPVFRQEFEALQKGSGFSSPDYSDISQKMSRIPDFRNTLYWNPDLITDENGKATLEFYTSDEPDDYILLVEGFTQDGRRGCTTLHFSIRNGKENNLK